MNLALAGAAVVVAIAAAVRSTWSPCGLSMLSTITPLTERARGHRFAATATWFVAGAVVGGTMLGGAGALLAWAVRGAGLSATSRLAAGAALALLAGEVDRGAFGVRPPFFKRQVDDDWLRRYRPWVYGAGFGWQIGVGLATYVMTAAVPLAVLLAALTASPPAALAVGAGFGLLRGMAVLAGATATSPVRLRALHARFDAWEAPVRSAVTVVELAVAVALVATVQLPAAAGLVAYLALSFLAGRTTAPHRSRRPPSPRPAELEAAEP